MESDKLRIGKEEIEKNEATFWSEAGDGLGCMFVLLGCAAVIVAIGYLLHGRF